jgi:hypothetical protein
VGKEPEPMLEQENLKGRKFKKKEKPLVTILAMSIKKQNAETS